METTLIIAIGLSGIAFGVTKLVLAWRKQVTAPKPCINKQGQECTKAEMEAELRPHKYPKKWPIEIPEEEAFD